MAEIWKQCPLGDRRYEISSIGDVRNTWTGQVLKPWYTKRGYRMKRICIARGVKQCFFVHRLVAITFLGPAPSPQHQVNHKNGIKDDNRVVNLEWVTPEENAWHAVNVLKVGCFGAKGEQHYKAQFTDAEVRVIKQRLKAGETGVGIAKELGVPKRTIGSIQCGQSWTHIQI